MKKLIIDRFEGEYAICEQEDKSMISILKADLPEHAIEGYCIIIATDGTIQIDEAETKERKERIIKLQEDLFE